MKTRIAWIVIAVAALAAIYWIARPGEDAPLAMMDVAAPLVYPMPAPRTESAPPAPAVVPTVPIFVPAPPRELPTPTHLSPDVAIPIQPGATIDFSTGAPHVRSGGADAEALAKALKEMEEATRNVTFPPQAPPPSEQPAKR